MVVCKFWNECDNFFGEEGRCKTGCIHNKNITSHLPNMFKAKQTVNKEEHSWYWDEDDPNNPKEIGEVLSVKKFKEIRGDDVDEKIIVRKYTELSENELMDKTNENLKDLLSGFGLSTYGKKTELVARLLGQTD